MAAILSPTLATAFAAPNRVAPMPTVRFNSPIMQVEAVAPPSEPVAPPKPVRKAEWNPKGLAVPSQLGQFAQQFESSYLNTAPAYLDGSMAGDVGFDPWALTVLAAPKLAPDALKDLDAKSRTAEARNERMLALSDEEQQAKLEWMRNSEIKHGRLAMLAVAGWPLSEFGSWGHLREAGFTNGRAPSLFNGHLLDFAPALLVLLAPIAYLEFQNKDRLPEGDYGFDPLGLAGEQRPLGAFPFDAFLAKKTPIDGVRYAKDMPAMKLAEIKNGRLAMMAITGMAVQEFVWGTPVVQQTPFFFGR